MSKSKAENDTDADGKHPKMNANHLPVSLICATLPDDLILAEILPRLPLKSIIRFKSVSKPWLSTISTPQFQKSLLKFSPHQFLLITSTPLGFRLFSYDHHNNLRIPVQLLFKNMNRRLLKKDFLGSCDGLVCYYGMTERYLRFFNVFNPFLNIYRDILLPDPDYSYHDNSWFGYTPYNNDYSIVALFRLHVDRVEVIRLCVFSLRTGQWRSMHHLDNLFTHIDRLRPQTVLINDDVLFFSLRVWDDTVRPNRVVGFDFVKEQLKEYPLMDWLIGRYTADFCMINRRLSLLSHYLKGNVYDVWVLKQYEDWSSWEKLFSVWHPLVHVYNINPFGKVLVLRRYKKNKGKEIRMIDPRLDTQQQGQRDAYCLGEEDVWRISPTGKLFMKNKGRQIMMIDPRPDTQQPAQGDAYRVGEEDVWHVVGYVESLISPFGNEQVH